MDRHPLALCGLLLFSLIGSGCSSLPIPEIDETGERIFKSGTTTPLDFNWSWPEPAFAAPPSPPCCTDPFQGVGALPGPAPTPAVAPLPAAAAAPAPATSGTTAILPPEFGPAASAGSPAIPSLPSRGGMLSLMPGRIVAPVGSEVLLVAGAVDERGIPLGGENVEWTLSQDSVGAITSIAETRLSLWDRLTNRSTPAMVTSSHAIGCTSRYSDVISRGTPDPMDDVPVSPGQTWIGVISTSEGTTHVTTAAGSMESGDLRQAVATIHWIDAQWTFPTPAIIPASQAHRLTTSVSRQTSAQPLSGWIVRYELAGGTAAQFSAGGASDQTALEVLTDASGMATVDLAPLVAEPGMAQVRIQVIRPAMQAGEPERFVAGEGLATITFSAPALSVRVSGPEMVERDDPASYQIEVRNPGDLPANQVVLSLEIPPGVAVTGSNPQAQTFGNRLQWSLGDMSPQDVRVLEVHSTAQQKGVVRWCARAESSDGVTAEGCVQSNIFVQALSMQLSGPETAEVGETVQFRIELTNVDVEPLTGVTLTDHFDEGLVHSEASSPIRRRYDSIEPGETVRLAVTFEVAAAGRLCHQLEAVADGGQRTTGSGCLVATQPGVPPRVSVRASGPDQANVGQQSLFKFVVTNEGDMPLTNVRIGLRPSAALTATLASPLHTWNEGEASWVVARLQPGESTEREIECRCMQVSEQACVMATVACDEGATAESSICLRIDAATDEEEEGIDLSPPTVDPPPSGEEETDVPPVVEPPDTDTEAPGQLKLSIVDLNDPLRSGATTTYLITIENEREVSDRNVSIVLSFTGGVEFDRIVDGPVGIRSASEDRRTISMFPIAEMRAGETIVFRVVAKSGAAGQGSLGVEVTSMRTSEKIEDTEATTITSP